MAGLLLCSNVVSIPFGDLPRGKQKCAMDPSDRETKNRRNQLRKWIAGHHGDQPGAQAQFVAAHKLNQGEISALLKNKSFGSKKARTLEQQVGMPFRYLEKMSDPSEAKGKAEAAASSKTAITTDKGIVMVPALAVVGSMGNGKPLPERDIVVEYLPLTKSWIRTNTPTVSQPASLAIISSCGDSMAPTFADGDILLVDRGVENIRLDAVYVLEWRNELYIKRVQRRIDGTIAIISDNAVYQPMVVEENDRDRLRVLGRVVWAWNGRKL